MIRQRHLVGLNRTDTSIKGSSKITTGGSSEMPKVHQKCVSIMLSSPKPLQQRLPAGLDKDFAFNSNAAGGQSTPLGKVLTVSSLADF
ncbi:TPA: hypothetical protein ACH3X2_004801 [Trebouxia sp. C0005]